MKKKSLLLLLIVLIIPFMVNAKDYTTQDIENDTDVIIFKKGDTIDYSSKSSKFEIYLDENKEDDNCYGGSVTGCNPTFTVKHDMIYIKSDYVSGAYRAKFMSYTSDRNYYKVDDLEDKHLYKTGDVIMFPSDEYSSFYYNENNQELFGYFRRYSEVLPQYQGKDITWQVHMFDDGGYGFVCPHFKPYTYIAPQFKIRCDDKSIDYGDKTKCYVYVIAKEELKEVSFDLGVPNFRYSGVEYPSNITSITGTGQFNLRIDQNKNLDTGMDLMSFYLHGTKNENYTDDIKLTGIHYRDAVIEDDYEVVKSNLNIIPKATAKPTAAKPVDNPKTLFNLLYALLPLFLLLISVGIVNLYDRNKEKI